MVVTSQVCQFVQGYYVVANSYDCEPDACTCFANTPHQVQTKLVFYMRQLC